MMHNVDVPNFHVVSYSMYLQNQAKNVVLEKS